MRVPPAALLAQLPRGPLAYDGIPDAWSGLTTYTTEAEYLAMLSVPAFANAWWHVVNEAEAWGYEIKPAGPGPALEELADVARALLSALPMADVHQACYLAGLVGWSPTRVYYQERTSLAGLEHLGARPWLLPTSAASVFRDMVARSGRVRAQWRNTGTDLQLTVYHRAGGTVTYPSEWWSSHYLIARNGNTYSPYGAPEIGATVWPLCRIIAQALAAARNGIGNLDGMVFAVNPIGGTGAPVFGEQAAKASAHAEEEITAALEMLGATGVLVEAWPQQFRKLDSGSKTSNSLAAYQQFALEILQAVTGQSLTVTTAGSGPAGSSGVQERTARSTAQALATNTTCPAVRDYLTALLRLNGYDVEDHETPLYVHGSASFVAPSRLRELQDLGPMFDREAVARAALGENGVSLLVPDPPPAATQAPPAPPAVGEAPPAEPVVAAEPAQPELDPAIAGRSEPIGASSSAGEGLRIVIAGSPGAGKSTLARALLDGLAAAVPEFEAPAMLATDDLISYYEWTKASARIADWMSRRGPWIVEGVRAIHALRRLLVRSPGERPCDIVVYMDYPHVELAAGQNAMRSGLRSFWQELRPELEAAGVQVIQPDRPGLSPDQLQAIVAAIKGGQVWPS